MSSLGSWPKNPKALFYGATAWNVVAGTAGLVATDFVTKLFYGDTLAGTGLLQARLFWLNVLIVGLGYLIVARDPTKNHGLAIVGGAGKAAEFFVWGACFLSGSATIWAVGAGTGNLIFALAFARFLLGRRA